MTKCFSILWHDSDFGTRKKLNQIGKLPVTCDDFELKKICHRAAPGFQLVRVKADIDPVTGCCKTTGQITVRYSNNQMLDDLIMGLQDANLHVEI